MGTNRFRLYGIAALLLLAPLLSVRAENAETLSQKDRISCDERSGPILTSDSPSKEYFQNLLRKGELASLEDFMTLWYPERKQSSDTESSIKKCQDDGICTQDTVYSW